MSRRTFNSFAVVISILWLDLFAQSGQPNPGKPRVASKTAAQSFAVVELFTFEGCSSCPPADKLMGELATNALENNWPVFALAFHVDYWDYIGWKDPYANRAYSERQQTYAAAFNWLNADWYSRSGGEKMPANPGARKCRQNV